MGPVNISSPSSSVEDSLSEAKMTLDFFILFCPRVVTSVVLSGETELSWEEPDGGGAGGRLPTAPPAAPLFCCGGRGGQESRSGSSVNA